jgi:hypothetical protein
MFMDLYADFARAHMQRYGTTKERAGVHTISPLKPGPPQPCRSALGVER